MFTFGARLVVEINATQALADIISTKGAITSLIAVTLLGALSGFVTGSGIAGNALFMTNAAAIGMNFDSIALFAAIQHSAAGHMAMAAIPVGVILLTALPNRLSEDDRNVMRTAFGLNIIILSLLLIPSVLFIANFI
mgnify:CR=1 FL=1